MLEQRLYWELYLRKGYVIYIKYFVKYQYLSRPVFPVLVGLNTNRLLYLIPEFQDRNVMMETSVFKNGAWTVPVIYE